MVEVCTLLWLQFSKSSSSKSEKLTCTLDSNIVQRDFIIKKVKSFSKASHFIPSCINKFFWVRRVMIEMLTLVSHRRKSTNGNKVEGYSRICICLNNKMYLAIDNNIYSTSLQGEFICRFKCLFKESFRHISKASERRV